LGELEVTKRYGEGPNEKIAAIAYQKSSQRFILIEAFSSSAKGSHKAQECSDPEDDN
jgi:hypothetical protein